MEYSNEINEFAAAMAVAQSEIENASKNADNPGFRSKYADLAEVLNTCRPILAKNGIAIIQGPGQFLENKLELTTMLVHKSGQWVKEVLTIPVAPKTNKTGGLAYDPQSAGSAITYARRYALAAMVGIAQEDDDGNGSSFVDPGNGKPKPTDPPPSTPPKENQKPNNPPPAPPASANACAMCGAKVSDAVKDYCLNRLRIGKVLCMDCQKKK